MSTFREDITNFCRNHVALCVLTLGIAIPVYCVGNLLGRLITYIKNPKGTAKAVDTVAKNQLAVKDPVANGKIDPKKVQANGPQSPAVSNASSAIVGKPKLAPKQPVGVDATFVKDGDVRRFSLKYKESDISSAAAYLANEAQESIKKQKKENPNVEPKVPVQKKKAALLHQAMMHRYSAAPGKNLPDIYVTKHNDASIYQLTEKHQPDYFSHKWTGKENTEVKVTEDYFDYSQSKKQFHVYTNFANKVLGGGWMGPKGFVQEEIMAFETPGFAALLSYLSQMQYELLTRGGNGGVEGADGWVNSDMGNEEKVMRGSPDPVLITGLKRVQAIDGNPKDGVGKAYGLGIDKMSEEDLLETTKKLTDAQNFVMLAIAAANLGKDATIQQQYDSRTLKDIFNTLVSGANLAKTLNKPNLLIHSGRFGAGAFNNSPEAVYYMHRLVKGYTGVDYKLHAYSDADKAIYDKTWDAMALKFAGKTLNECLDLISAHLKQRDGV